MTEIKTPDGQVYIKKYIRADVDTQVVQCRNCKADIIRRDLRQIVYFCSKNCRKAYRKAI